MKQFLLILIALTLTMCSPWPHKDKVKKREIKKITKELEQYNKLRLGLEEKGVIKHQVDTAYVFDTLYFPKVEFKTNLEVVHDTVRDERRVDSLIAQLNASLSRGRDLAFRTDKLSESQTENLRNGVLTLLRENPQFRDTTIVVGNLTINIDKAGQIKVTEAEVKKAYKKTVIVDQSLPWIPNQLQGIFELPWYWLLLILLLLFLIYKLITRK